MALFIAAYDLQHRFQPFMSSSTLVSGLDISARELEERLPTAAPSKRLGGPQSSTAVQTGSSRARLRSKTQAMAPGLLACVGVPEVEPGLDKPSASILCDSPPNTPARSGGSGGRAAASNPPEQPLASLGMGKAAQVVRSAMRMLSLSVDYNYLVRGRDEHDSRCVAVYG